MTVTEPEWNPIQIIVTTPTANIGKVVMEELLKADAEVTLFAPKSEKVQAFVERGAEVLWCETRAVK